MRFRLFWLLLSPSCALAAALTPGGLRCEYLEAPLAVEDPKPRLSWTLSASQPRQFQKAYALRAATSLEKLSLEKPDLWDSGRIEGNATARVRYAGKPLKPGQTVFWQVRVWDAGDEASTWSAPALWRNGLPEESWTGSWICARDEAPLPAAPDALHLPPARYFRKEFEIAKPVRRATAYLSALGNAELHFNGKRAADAQFLPGWSDYHQRAYYRAFDVTPLLQPGPNAFGAVLTDGWYAGYVGFGRLHGYGPNKSGRFLYGKNPAFLAQIQVEFEDGSKKTFATDKTWKTTTQGPLREADLLMGESYDATRELPGWDLPGFNAALWENVQPAAEQPRLRAPFFDNNGEREVDLAFRKPARLQAYPAPPVRVCEELHAQKITEPSPGTYIFDFGTNFAGVVRLRIKGQAGTRVQLRYGEMLHPDGRLMTENLRKARATDSYTLKGDPAGEEWSPRFTYHGFQFCEVSGLPQKPDLDTLRGLVLQSDCPGTGSFECSDPLINKLYANILRTQRSNFLEIPTDCSQRDERLGWLGDAQIFLRAATYNADVAAFFTKWLEDVAESQRSFGAFPDYAPYPMGHGEPGKNFGPAWSDAGIICPHTLWQVYGDTAWIQRHWGAMTRFMAFRQASSPSFQGSSIGNAWGDWLNLRDRTPIEFLDAAYFAHSAKLMSEMASAIERPDEAALYAELFTNIKNTFAATYLSSEGLLKVSTQTACVLALEFDLLPPENRPTVTGQLVKLLDASGTRMTTGFLGTKHLLPALTHADRAPLALRLFLSRDYPSWAYPVLQGANSVWERWDSFSKEKGFGGDSNAAMNSFSHYSFGAVAQWMFQSLAGIDTDGPGFRKILLKPLKPSSGSGSSPALEWVRASYDSPGGRILAAWKLRDKAFEYQTEVPPNTSATLFLPSHSTETITINGAPVEAAPGARLLRYEEKAAVFALEPGAYSFLSKFGD